MKKFLLAILLLLNIPAFAEDAEGDIGQPENVESVTVLVSSSMTSPLSLISREYSRTHGVDLNAVFESPAELVLKIDEGDPADIIIVSDQVWLDDLQERGLIDASSRIKIAENRLSLVVSRNFKMVDESKQLESALDYIHSRALMVMANPTTGALGERTAEVLRNIDKWDKFKRFVVLAPTSAKTVDMIIKSQTAGIVYSTDARLYADNLKYIGDIPQTLHDPVEYWAAIVLGNNMDEAREFLSYLSSKPAKEVFTNAGFVVK